MFVSPTILRRMARWMIAALALSAFIAPAGAKTQQQTFKSADEAFAALVDAARSGDKKRMTMLFGPESDRLGASDPVVARAEREAFVAAFEQSHEVQRDAKNRATLVVGKDGWPFPVPLVNAAGRWRFDTAAGLQQVLDRRIGRNELNAIEVLLAIVDAQREYASTDRNGDGLIEYAQQFASDAGTHNGLYWPTRPGEKESPLGPLVARATKAGYPLPDGRQAREPYWGYYYRMLSAQGEAAQGGAYSYMAGTRMIGGFAVVAYPAEYRESAVKSFIVNQDGTVYEKDLGPKSRELAEAMTSFNPAKGWNAVSAGDGK
jgi:hypothetical protein